ncbi:MAG: glutaredoxin domain-containing protein [Kiloniellales bacterium]|nr:glutaredoxin domain-containing protein [Kiloniellales bacterium]
MAKIEIFSAPDCGYCRRAKELLDGKGLAYRELDIAADPAQLGELRRRLPRSKAIPQIFIDGEHIGGYEDLCLLEARGELDALSG